MENIESFWKMKTFKILIEEIVSDSFEVIAKNEIDALAIAKEKYYNGEFVLEPGNLIDSKISIIKEAYKGRLEM